VIVDEFSRVRKTNDEQRDVLGVRNLALECRGIASVHVVYFADIALSVDEAYCPTGPRQ
jgi:hypothetical protein